MTPLDDAWAVAHPLPSPDNATDKNSRGRVLVVGGARFVPGALRLTGEAALRAGCGKLQLATVADAAMALGVLVPEAAMIALPAGEHGEIGADAIPVLQKAVEHCDAFVLGPGMSDSDSAAPLLEALCGTPREGLSVVLDAAALGAVADLAHIASAHGGRAVLTPHHGEMASMIGCSAEAIADDPACFAREATARYNAIIVLKWGKTIIASPDGHELAYPGGGVGLATGGSGDVLAGIIGGLLSRGTDPFAAAAWGVWLHGEAGRKLACDVGPLGFLARELLPLIPALMATTHESQMT